MHWNITSLSLAFIKSTTGTQNTKSSLCLAFIHLVIKTCKLRSTAQTTSYYPSINTDSLWARVWINTSPSQQRYDSCIIKTSFLWTRHALDVESCSFRVADRAITGIDRRRCREIWERQTNGNARLLAETVCGGEKELDVKSRKSNYSKALSDVLDSPSMICDLC